jgi:fucose permease
MFIFGLVLALPGTLFGVPAWTAAVGGDVASQANLLVVFFAGQLMCTAAAGILVDHIGAQRVLLGGGTLAAAGFLLLARAAGPPAAAVGLALLAAGGSSFNAGSNTLVSVTFGERRGAMLPLMGVACAIGACLTPFVLSASASVATIGERLLVLAAASAMSTIAPLAIGRAPHSSAGISLGSMLSIASDRWLIGLTALTAVEFGVEAVIAGWSAAYALAVVPGASGGLVVTLYWGALAGGRSLTPLVLGWRSKASTVAAAAGLVAAGIAVMAQAESPAALYSGALLTGMAVGPLAPTLIGVAGDRYPNRTGLAIGVLLSLAQLGGVTLPWLTGRAALAEGFRAAMVVPLGGALVVLAGAATIRIRRAA